MKLKTLKDLEKLCKKEKWGVNKTFRELKELIRKFREKFRYGALFEGYVICEEIDKLTEGDLK